MFSRELVQVLNETNDKKKNTIKVKEKQGFSYHFAVNKVTRRPKLMTRIVHLNKLKKMNTIHL
jgi:hypothetical protein